MVLVRVRSQGDACFKHTIVPWVIEESRPVLASVETLLPDLDHAVAHRIVMQRVDVAERDLARHPITAGEFCTYYDFYCRGTRVEMRAPGHALKLTPGMELFMVPRGQRLLPPPVTNNDSSIQGIPTQHASKFATSPVAAGQSPILASTTMGDESAPLGATPPQQQRKRVTLTDIVSKEPPATGAAGADPSVLQHLYGNDGASTALDESASVVGSSMRQQLQQFLHRHHLEDVSVRLASIGVHTLAGLCGRMATEISPFIHDDKVMAFHLISAAHEEMRRQGLRVDWRARLESLYERYNSTKVMQVPSLLQAYVGEEEQLWGSLREKYEAEVAAIARTEFTKLQVLEAPVQPALGNVSDVLQTRNAVDGSAAPVAVSRHEGTLMSAQAQSLLACPACQHKFPAPTVSIAEVHHIEELQRMQQELEKERGANKVLLAEQTSTIKRLTDQLGDVQALSNHYQGICREQEEWLAILERRVQQQETQLRSRDRTHTAQEAADAAVAGAAAYASPFTSSRGGGPIEDMSSSALPSSNANNTMFGSPNNKSGAMQSSAMSPSAPEDVQRVRRKLVDFYVKHAPEKVQTIDAVMTQWRGREAELEKLVAIEPALVRLGAQKQL